MQNIATHAHPTRARCQFGYRRLTVASTLGYHPSVSAKKALMGFGRPGHRCSESRSSPADIAAFSFAPPFLVARREARKGLPVRASGAWSSNPSSYRPHLDVGAVVLSNRTAWRPHMAQIIQSPYAGQPPVIQTRIRGRLPNAVGNLWRARVKRDIAARESALLQERINAYRHAIADAEGYAYACRITLSELTRSASTNASGAAHV